MSPFGNFPHVYVGKEPKSRTQHETMNWNQETSTAEKEDGTDSTAEKITTAFTSISIKAEKENDTDSTATTTTATATYFFESK